MYQTRAWDMSLVNVCVISSVEKKTLLSWNIVSLIPPNVTFAEFFKRNCCRMCDRDISKDDLVSAFVSQRKEQVDPVDANLPMV